MENTENNTEIDVGITSEKAHRGIYTQFVAESESAKSQEFLKTLTAKSVENKPKRGRKKKVETVGDSELAAYANLAEEEAKAAAIIEQMDDLNKKLDEAANKASCGIDIPSGYRDLRDHNGLIKNLQYKYDTYGFVDWRAMINPKHVVLNRNSVAKAGLNYEALSDADREKFLAEWPDEKKIIKLAGFKEVARLRGYNIVKNRVEQVGEKVICHCKIEWVPNYENNQYFTYTAAASASPANVAPEYSQALEAIACNRAFARAVRESLNIHVVSDEELDPNKVEEVSNAKIPSTHPRAQLIKKCGEMGIEFPAVKTMIVGLGLDNIDIVSFDTIPGPTAMSVLDEVRKSQVK